MVSDRPSARGDIFRWVGHGAVGGVLAGVLFIMFQMLIAAFQTGAEGFFLPLRAMATLVAGPEAMGADFPTTRAVVTGMLAHLWLATIGGMLFGLVAGLVPGLGSSSAGLIGLGALYGLGLWFAAGLGLTPIGWSQYLVLSDPLIQILAYVFFFGGALGSYLAFVRPRRGDLPEWMVSARSYHSRPRAHRAV
jgi:hypothetical protein